jgi:translation initiation factor 1
LIKVIITQSNGIYGCIANVLTEARVEKVLMNTPQNDRKIVWSSEDGDLRKQEDKLAIVNSLPPQQQTVYLHRESKGRGGKGVTLVKGLVLSEGDLSALAKKLKQICGSGGTVKDGVIEIQGEQREKIADTLRKLGYKVKVAGG